MADTSNVPADINGFPGQVIVQGFSGEDAYVFIGNRNPASGSLGATQFALTPENAHVLSEEIRKHAESAANAAEGE